MRIDYKVNDKAGDISWAAAEEFKELTGKEYALGEMEAARIERMADLSLTAKILLSAVAGAIIQRLLDTGEEPEDIFRNGRFWIQI